MKKRNDRRMGIHIGFLCMVSRPVLPVKRNVQNELMGEVNG